MQYWRKEKIFQKLFDLPSILTNDYENNSGNANPSSNPNPVGKDGGDNAGDDGTVDQSVGDSNDVGENNNCTADEVNNVGDIDNSRRYAYSCGDDDTDDNYNDDIETND